MVALSETLHHEMALMAPHVKVSVLCPGWVRTRSEQDRRRQRAEPPDAETTPRPTPGSRRCCKPLIDNGMPPDEVAAKVLAAIRAEQFWILPHDDTEDVLGERS